MWLPFSPISLSAAFDVAVREFALGAQCDFQGSQSDHVDILMAKGVAQHVAVDIAQEIASAGDRLMQLDVPATEAELLRSLHTDTWFQVRRQSKVLRTAVGSRQGCRFGGLVFNVIYEKTLGSIRKRAKEAGLIMQMWCDRSKAVWLACNEGEGLATDVGETTYVDDQVNLLQAGTPRELLRQLRLLTTIVLEECTSHGLKLNLKKGKTEAMVHLRGKAAKQTMFTGAVGDERSVAIEGHEGKRVLVVNEYKHLGSPLCSDHGMQAWANARVKSARVAYVPLARKAFGWRTWKRTSRTRLGWSLVCSRLLYNVHVWHRFGGKPRRTLNRMYMRLWMGHSRQTDACKAARSHA